jgi:CHAT domain-containing protein/Tfp pilus assembly protein PilF
LLSWSRGEAREKIDSPFDLYRVESQESPLGAITLDGLRGNRSQTWVVQQTGWSLGTRPNFTGSLARQYRAGLQFIHRKKVGKGVACWREAANQVANSQPPSLRAWLILQGAVTLAGAKLWKEADQAYEESIRLAANFAPDSLPTLYSWWAYSFYGRNEWDKAETYHREALTHALKSGGESVEAASILLDLSRVVRFTGNLSLGEEYALKALEIQERLAPESIQAAWTLNQVANILVGREDLARAEEFARRAMELQAKLNPGSLDLYTASDLDVLALVAWYRGDFATAEAQALQALKIQRADPSSGSSLEVLGLLAWYRGDFRRARICFQQELAINHRSGPGTNVELTALYDLAVVYDHDGELREAEAQQRRALLLSRRLADRFMISASLDSLGMIAFQRGDLNGAERYFTRAVEGAENLSPALSSAAEFLSDLGRLFEVKGDFSKAEAAYRRALAIRGKVGEQTVQYAEVLAALAGIKHRQGQYALAAEYYERALAALESQTERLGGSDDIRAGFRAQRRNYYSGYVDVLLEQKQTEHAFQVLERSRARTLLEMLASAHIDVRKGADPDLLKEERSLLGAIKAKSERRIRLLNDGKDEEQAKALEKEISSATTEFQDVEAQIRTSSPSYAALTQPEPLTARQIQEQLLDPDTLLLEYSLGKERSYVFAVTPDSLEAFALPKGETIEKAARRLYALLMGRNRGVRGETKLQRRQRLAGADAAYARVAAGLSRMVLGPVAGRLQNKRLLIVADGALQYVPFAALPEPADLAAAPLALNHEIVNLPSASVLAVLRQQEKGRTPAPKTVAVMADPVFNRSDARVTIRGITHLAATQATRGPKRAELDALLAAPTSAGLLTRSAGDIGLSRNGQFTLPRLRFSRLEAEAIMKVTPTGSGMEALDFAANRAMATSPELSQYRMIHFATHGLLNSQHPELSGLVLSLVNKDGKAQEGFLQLQDIYNLDLPADLVVLSSCETALGKDINGEGIIGLTRGFMYAGASRVVASLWKVSDAATAELMAAFYQAMEADGMRPAAALRAAQIQMFKQKRWRSPYYWAAFQLQGEWK